MELCQQVARAADSLVGARRLPRRAAAVALPTSHSQPVALQIVLEAKFVSRQVLELCLEMLSQERVMLLMAQVASISLRETAPAVNQEVLASCLGVPPPAHPALLSS